MVMKWFTESFHRCDLSDEEMGHICEWYQQYMNRLSLELPGNLAVLTTINLHDGYVVRFEVSKSTNLIEMTVLRGDLQSGYSYVTIHFYGGVIFGAEDEDVVRWLRNSEIIYEELEVIDSRCELRLLLWPYREFGISFSSVGISQAPASPEDRVRVEKSRGADE